jgi:hypothetical protein
MFMLFILLFAVSMLFLGLALPIWAIIDCATSEERTNQSKVIWIIVIVVLWTAGACIYGIVSSQGRLRVASVISLFVFILMFVWLFSFAGAQSPQISSALNQYAEALHSRSISTGSLAGFEVEHMESDLRELARADKSIFGLRKMKKSLQAIRVFKSIAQDNKISVEEYNIWKATINVP